MLKLLKIKDERGGVLILTVVIISILTMLGAAFVNLITHDYRNADQQRRWVQVYYIAEAGVAKAWFTLKNDVIKGFDGNLGNIIMGPDGTTGTEETEKDDGALSVGSSVDFGAGNFSVRIADNDDGDGDNFIDSDGTAKIVSTGTIGKIERTINVMFTIASSPSRAIITGGDLNINGGKNLIIQGGIHSNGVLTIGGNPQIGEPISDGDDYKVAVPDYHPKEGYELKGNGNVFDVANQQTLTNPGSFNGWEWNESNDEWNFSGNTPFDGTYYIECDAEVSGSPEPWMANIIAIGNITISGSPNLSGTIFTHKQISIHGNASINGAVIAKEATSISAITGSVTITYNSDFLPNSLKVYTGQLGLLSWH